MVRQSCPQRWFERFPAAVQWIRDMGVQVGAAQQQLAFGRGHQFDTNHYIDRCREEILGNGQILTGTTTASLVRDGSLIRGARLTLPDGSDRTVTARGTLLATGGFQADSDLMAELVHPAARTAPLRSSASSSGDGFRLGSSVGAATGAKNAGFYGHLIPSGIAFADPSDFVDLSLYYSEHGLLFNINNERFTDESLADHLTTMALLDQPESRGLLVADARVHRDHIVKPYVAGAPSVDKFDLAYRRGGRCGVAESLDELAELPEEWGYDGAAHRRTHRNTSTGTPPAAYRCRRAEPWMLLRYRSRRITSSKRCPRSPTPSADFSSMTEPGC